MTDLEALKAELARQDRELEACLEQIRALDPETQIFVSPETLEQLQAKPKAAAIAPPASWFVRV